MEFSLLEAIKGIQMMNDMMIQIQLLITSYLEDEDSPEMLFDILQQNNILNDISLFHDFLCMLNSISYSRLKKIEKDRINEIIINLKDQIQESFTKNEIYNIFNSNPPILLSLYENGIIKYEQISKCQNFSLGNYFLAEKIEHEGIETPNSFMMDETIIHYQSHLNDYIVNRKEYHSESEIAKSIRNDDIDNFTDLIGQTNLQLDSTIPQSIFESNVDLYFNNKSLIEYAASFGSLNIFKFLFSQLQTFPPNVFNAAVIGGNPEIIQLLEEKGYKPDSLSLTEAVINHRNDIFEYFTMNYEIEIDFDLFIDSINSFNYFIMNELLVLHQEYLTNCDFLNQIFSDVCEIDFRSLFNSILSIPTIDINYKLDNVEKVLNISFLNEILI